MNLTTSLILDDRKREYKRRYRAKHKNQISAYQREYRLLHRDELNLKRRERREYYREYYRKRYINLRDKLIEQHRQYRHDNKEKIKNYSQKYYEEHKPEKRAYFSQYKKEHKPEENARSMAERHIDLSDTCAICNGATDLERHHPDYSKPLEIVTLCRSCHKRTHAGLQIEQIQERRMLISLW